MHTEEKISKITDSIYNICLNGNPKIKITSAKDLADEYFKKNNYDKNKAIDNFINWQIAKCATSGFISGLGGIITLPVTIPANISSVIFIQMRMIMIIAYINGFNPEDDHVKTLIFICLCGKNASKILENISKEIGKKVTTNALKRLPGKMLIEINKKIGFRLFTKFGEKGVINLSKGIPIVGGVIGGSFDSVTTKIIANVAKKNFCEKEIIFSK